MKRLLTMALVLGMCTFGLNLFAQAQNESGTQSGAAAQQQQQPDAASSQSARSFEGKIAKEKGKLVLKDTATGQSYQIDDQDKAKQFEGKTVKVTATMDPSTNSLHVVDIQSAGEQH